MVRKGQRKVQRITSLSYVRFTVVLLSHIMYIQTSHYIYVVGHNHLVGEVFCFHCCQSDIFFSSVNSMVKIMLLAWRIDEYKR